MKTIFGKEEMFRQLKESISQFVAPVDRDEVLREISIDRCCYLYDSCGGKHIEDIFFVFGAYHYSVISWEDQDYLSFVESWWDCSVTSEPVIKSHEFTPFPSETLEEMPVETSENYSSFSDSETLFDSEREEYNYTDFGELARFCGCENFTPEQCASELSHLLYGDIELSNKLLHELHPFDQETLYLFYMSAKLGKNSWRYLGDAPLEFCFYDNEYFFAYSEEEKGET